MRSGSCENRAGTMLEGFESWISSTYLIVEFHETQKPKCFGKGFGIASRLLPLIFAKSPN